MILFCLSIQAQNLLMGGGKQGKARNIMKKINSVEVGSQSGSHKFCSAKYPGSANSSGFC